jgi:hypothetical protein
MFTPIKAIDLQLTLDEAISQACLNLIGLASNRESLTIIGEAFGNNFSVGAVTGLLEGWSEGDFGSLPKIEIRQSNEINGAKGAFAAAINTIYLSEEYLANNIGNTSKISAVLLEEIGHWVDSQINKIDASGDEGAIFSALVRREYLSQEQLSILKLKNDFATANIDGSSIAIEQSTTYTGSNLGQGVSSLANFFSNLQNTLNNFSSNQSLALVGNNIWNNSEFKWLSSVSSSINGINALDATDLVSKLSAISGLTASNFSETADAVTFNLAANSSRASSTSLASSLALPGLGLNIGGNAGVKLNFNLGNIQVNINKISTPSVATTNTLGVGVEASLANNFSAIGKIGFLQIEAKDDQLDPNGSSIKANFIINPNGIGLTHCQKT